MDSEIRKSQNYIWSTQDLLGCGATSNVYKGINRSNGSPVAIKALSVVNVDRELEILTKLNHENIVKLLAIETEEHQARGKIGIKRQVIITELCTGGSLGDILTDPENIDGLDDVEYLLLLSHLFAGMKYLRDNEIVHRDLKPSNIMKFIKDDGSAVYKLIDFGAARQLSDKNDFKSLYGTEEYLHPDMYERAFLGCATAKAFRATVDLWSTGVTLYHAASGELPFRPFGGRRNKATMFHITTQKKSGVISGIQREPNGPIYWQTELPTTCLLSPALRKIITTLIAGLLESDNRKIWTFRRFFDEVSLILSKKLVHVFNMNSQVLNKFYLNPDDMLCKNLQELIFEQTGIDPECQILVYKSLIYRGAGIPVTSEDNPVFFSSKEIKTVDVAASTREDLPETIAFTLPVNKNHDAIEAKKACCHAYSAKRNVEKLALHSKLICEAVESFNRCIVSIFDDLNRKIQYLKDKAGMLERTAEILEVSQGISEYVPKTNVVNKLRQYRETFTNDTAAAITDLYKKHSGFGSQWDKVTKECKNPYYTGSVMRAKTLVDQLRALNRDLRTGDNKRPYLSEGDEYILTRRKMRQVFGHLIISLLKAEVSPQHKILKEKFDDWHKVAQIDLLKIDILTEDIKEFESYLDELKRDIEAENSQYNEHLKLNLKTTKVLNGKLKSRLKMYNSRTESVDNVIAENAKIRRTFQKFTFDLETDNYSSEE